MNWKKWPSWLKGGTILLVLFIFYTILKLMLFPSFCLVETEQGIADTYCPFFTQLKLFFTFDFISFLYRGVFLFFIGAVVGLIIDKIKSKK